MVATNGMSPDVLDKIYKKGASTAPVLDAPDGSKVVLLPEGYEAHHMQPLEKQLTRIRQGVTFYDVASFTAYVNRFKSEASRIFALPGHLASDRKPTVNAILDYHEGNEAALEPRSPDYCVHTARYLPRYSEQWERWIKAGPMSQVAFAEFVEENRRDIQQPEAAMLLDIVRKFKATKKQDYDSAVYQEDGSVMVNWSDKVESAGRGVAVPSQLLLSIPVYFLGPLYSVDVFMRYRIDGGKLIFVVKVDRPDYIEQDAFSGSAERHPGITKVVAKETGIEVYLGASS